VGKELPVPTDYELAESQELVWTFWRRAKSVSLPGIEILLGDPESSLVTIPFELSRVTIRSEYVY
jgi:hypothetical protein